MRAGKIAGKWRQIGTMIHTLENAHLLSDRIEMVILKCHDTGMLDTSGQARKPMYCRHIHRIFLLTIVSKSWNTWRQNDEVRTRMEKLLLMSDVQK